MPRTRRRAIEVERTRSAIVDAAASSFAKHGFAESKMADIAKAAGYTTPTLYAYFEGKQAIIDALADTVEAEFEALFEQPVPEGLTLEQRLEFAVSTQLAWCDSRREAFAALMSRPAGVAAHRPLDGASMTVRAYTPILAAYAVDGRIGPLLVEQAAFHLYGILNAFFVRATRAPGSPSLASEARLVVRLFLRGAVGHAA